MIFDVKYFILWWHLSSKVQITFAKVSFTGTWLVCTFWLSTANAPVVLDKLTNALVTIFSADTFLTILKFEINMIPYNLYECHIRSNIVPCTVCRSYQEHQLVCHVLDRSLVDRPRSSNCNHMPSISVHRILGCNVSPILKDRYIVFPNPFHLVYFHHQSDQ